MEHSRQVVSVRYGFYTNALFEGLEKPNRYDVAASERGYAELCRERLQMQFPSAKTVDITYESGSAEGVFPPTMQPQVLVQAGDDIDSLVPLAAELNLVDDLDLSDEVKHICQEAFSDFDHWLVSRTWLRLEDVCKQSQIPVPALRWLCSNGFIEEAERTSTSWEFPSESLADLFTRHGELRRPFSVLSVSSTDNRGVDLHLLPREALDTQPKLGSRELWVWATQDLAGLPFDADDWSLLFDNGKDECGIVLEHHYNEAHWRDQAWSYTQFTRAMASEARAGGTECDVIGGTIDGLPAIVGVTFKCRLPTQLLEGIQGYAQRLATQVVLLRQSAHILLSGGPRWRADYERDEDAFCRQILEPLLRRMGFDPVIYTHGVNEYGRDSAMAEPTRFGEILYYGLQAKAGNVNGGANSDIDEIMGQVDDALKMPFGRLGAEPVHIAVLIIAISGRFTANARAKIRHKMPTKQVPVGSVYFWDKAKILTLIARYWGEAHF